MATNEKNAYEQLIAAARLAITEDIRDSAVYWKMDDRLDDFLIDRIQPTIIPDGANLRWALTVIELRPEILHRQNDEHTSTAWDGICEAIEEQVLEDLRREFRPITDKLVDSDWDFSVPYSG